MAPEIRKGLRYDGRQADIFSIGVILFIIVKGIFPFWRALDDDYHYNLIKTGQHDRYWDEVKGKELSNEFKDLVLKIFAVDGSKRPTLDEIKAHPWINKSIIETKVRESLI